MRKVKTFGLWLLVFGALLALAAGCARQGGQQAAKEIVIGFNGPLSGPAAEYGRDCANGVEMAINEINEAGGITVGGQKYVFRLEKLDHRADPSQAVANARRFRDQFKARVVFDCVFNCIAPQLEINQEKGNEFLMMAWTSTPKMVELGNKFVVAIPPPFTAYMKAFMDMAWQEGYRKVAMVVTTGAYGDEWRSIFKQEWQKRGGVITADQPANYYAQTDFSAQLTAALATKPDALLIGGPSSTTALVIEQARNLGFKGGFILVDQAKMDYIVDEVFKGKMDQMGTTIGVGAVGQYPTPAAKSFNEKYQAKYQVHNTWEAAGNYTAMHALAKAMVAAGTVEDVSAIRAAFDKVFPMSGDKYPTEILGIHKNGQMLMMPLPQEMKNGKYQDPWLMVYWTRTQEGFERVKEKLSVPQMARWVPLEGYYVD